MYRCSILGILVATVTSLIPRSRMRPKQPLDPSGYSLTYNSSNEATAMDSRMKNVYDFWPNCKD